MSQDQQQLQNSVFYQKLRDTTIYVIIVPFGTLRADCAACRDWLIVWVDCMNQLDQYQPLRAVRRSLNPPDPPQDQSVISDPKKEAFNTIMFRMIWEH